MFSFSWGVPVHPRSLGTWFLGRILIFRFWRFFQRIEQWEDKAREQETAESLFPVVRNRQHTIPAQSNWPALERTTNWTHTCEPQSPGGCSLSVASLAKTQRRVEADEYYSRREVFRAEVSALSLSHSIFVFMFFYSLFSWACGLGLGPGWDHEVCGWIRLV